MKAPQRTLGGQAAFSERAHRVIPGGAHTYSKGDDQLPANAPRGFARGKGARVWDLDGREFVDWGMGINCVLIGHAEPSVDDEAIAAIRKGQNLSRPTPVEISAAEQLIALHPQFDMVKFSKNGSDVNSAALRLSRAFTGRDFIGFDGTASFLSVDDWFIGNTVMDAGVPDQVRRLAVPFRYNDLASVERVFAEHGPRLAAVIMEACREERPLPGFLEGVRRLCDRNGTLLIFDEIVTGFRYALGAIHPTFGVVPDLMTLGKGMANGYSLSALLGKREIMERGGLGHPHPRVFLLSATHGAEQSALAAMLATVRFYQEHDVIGHLAESGRALMDGLNRAAREHGIASYLRARSDFPSRPVIDFLDAEGMPSAELRTLFIQELITKGVFMPWACPSFRNGAAELAQTLDAFDDAGRTYARAIEQRSVRGLLEGPAARPVFRPFN